MPLMFAYDAATDTAVERDLTPEELTTQDQIAASVVEIETRSQQMEQAKASALAKLEALGLTAEEAQAIAGI